MHVIDRQILKIALPAIVSNITVPLLGLVDLTIVGHLGAEAYIGAISVGGMIFNVMYWIFGFIRMGTSGLTAQAYGRKDWHEVGRLFSRSLLIAALLSALLLLLQVPIRHLALAVMSPSEEVRRYVEVYFNICVWGTLPSLSLSAFSGWFLGLQDSRTPMTIAIAQNITNIVASLLFVYVLGMKVEGVALGTLIAQYAGMLMAVAVYFLRYGKVRRYVHWKGVMVRSDMMRFFRVNRDIFFRTICLVSVFLFFTSAGAWQNDTVLAANAIFMQFYILFSYIMDGFAFAGEAVCGRFYGAGDRPNYLSTVRRLFKWGGAMALVFTLAYILADDLIVGLITDEASVVACARDYRVWVWLVPIAGIGAFIWDGIFIGITASRQMLISSVVATVLFFSLWYFLFPIWQNHALWFAFIVYILARGVVQTVLFRKL